MNLNILFVDDDPNVLGGIRRMLRPLRQQWSTEFAEGGSQALTLMEKTCFDVVVTDMRMPGMTGIQLLEEVCRRYPKTIRIILSGQCDEEASARAVRVAHRMLSKPCDAEILKATVAGACAQRELLVSESLMSLVTRQDTIPSLPSLYVEVVRELDSSDPSLDKVSHLIARDPGMSAKILQMANSAFFGVRTPASNPKQAVTLLGLETMRVLVLAVSVFSQFEVSSGDPLLMETLWDHSRETSELATAIAKAEGISVCLSEQAAVAGLLHDIGKLILLNSLPDTYQNVLTQVQTSGEPLWEVERAAFGASHAEVGACLLGLWGLPAPIVEAVAWHHRPSECFTLSFSPLTAVHVANALLNGKGTDASLDIRYLERLDVLDHVRHWQEFYDRQRTGGRLP